MKPAIIYNDQLLKKDFLNHTFKQIHSFTDELLKKLKTATGYTWDNTEFYYETNGETVLQLSFFDESIAVYADGGCCHIASIGIEIAYDDDDKPITLHGDKLTADDLHQIELMAREIYIGMRRCNCCNKPFKVDSMHRYSFAGIVCNNCFDPKHHKQPDSR